MKYTVLLMLVIPFACEAMTFKDYTDLVYEHAAEKIDNDAKIKSADISKNLVLSPLPVNLGVNTKKIAAKDSAESGFEYSVMSAWTFKFPGLKNAQSAEWDIVKENLSKESGWIRKSIAVELKHEWLKYEAAENRAAIYDHKVQVALKGYESGKKQFGVGRMSHLELIRLESEYVRAKEEFQKAKMEAEHIQHLMQEDALSHEPIRIEDMRFTYLQSYDRLSSYIATSNLIQAMQRKIDEVKARIAVSRESKIESFTVGVGVTREPVQNSLDLSLNIPIGSENRQEFAIAALMNEQSNLEHQKQIIQNKLEIAIESLSEHLREREAMIRQSERGEKYYETLFSMAEKAFQGGVMSQFEYLSAKKEYFDAQIRTIELREEYIDETYEIESKLGETVL